MTTTTEKEGKYCYLCRLERINMTIERINMTIHKYERYKSIHYPLNLRNILYPIDVIHPLDIIVYHIISIQ